MPLSADARDLNWLIANFAKRTPGVAHAMVVSADGLPIAVSERLDRAMADQLAAIASGVASLSQGAARYFAAGTVKQTVVEMERGFLFVMAISDGSCLTVLAATASDVGGVGYEMATPGHPRRRGPHPQPAGRIASRPAAMSTRPPAGGPSGLAAGHVRRGGTSAAGKGRVHPCPTLVTPGHERPPDDQPAAVPGRRRVRPHAMTGGRIRPARGRPGCRGAGRHHSTAMRTPRLTLEQRAIAALGHDLRPSLRSPRGSASPRCHPRAGWRHGRRGPGCDLPARPGR